MPLLVETPQRVLNKVALWNRKLHYYIGLYLLFFLWLFAFTGLLLNHPKWTFAEFWPNREQSVWESKIDAPPAGGDLVQARDLMRQLGIQGEIEWTASRENPSRFDFRASRPGHIFEIKADLAQGRASVQRIELNTWGVLHILHTFTGVRRDDKRNSRDWSLTMLWAFAMDATAVGLIVMVCGSYFLWYPLLKKRRLGWLALGSGLLVCALFTVGLRWLSGT